MVRRPLQNHPTSKGSLSFQLKNNFRTERGEIFISRLLHTCTRIISLRDGTLIFSYRITAENALSDVREKNKNVHIKYICEKKVLCQHVDLLTRSYKYFN